MRVCAFSCAVRGFSVFCFVIVGEVEGFFMKGLGVCWGVAVRRGFSFGGC